MSNAREMWGGWSVTKRWSFAVGFFLIIGMAAMLAWWTTRVSYEVLFGDLKAADAAEIATTLDGWQIPHRYANGGATVLVPGESVYDTRMKLVAQGIPHGGSVGFELFKDSDFGVTEFAQRVNYQRALQGELERTISSLSEIQSARVHLTLRRATMFESEDAPSKASVSLTLQPSRSIAVKQVTGIQRLVASAVDGLSPDAVVVIGEGGVVLSGTGIGTSDLGDEQSRIENRLKQRIDGMLRDTLGENARYSVSVDVQLNFNRVKQVRDRLMPQGKDGNGLLVRQKTINSRSTPQVTGTDVAPPATGSGESELEYAHSREQEEVEVAPGRIERLSVGIVVPKGTDATSLEKLQNVIAAAIGLNPERGDRLDIASVATASTARTIPRIASSASAPPTAARAGHVHFPLPWLLVGASALVAILCFLGGLTLAGFRQPKRLDRAQRERLLRDIQRWIDSPERL